jgi:acetolactate synthase-1/2/3 large subunit
MQRIADSIFKRLRSEVSCIYYVSGGGAMHLVDALGRSGIQSVAAIHEMGAGFMAIGHAMATNGLGVCLVTSGPGSTNVITAVAAAWMDSVPVLFISGQAKSTSLVGDSGRRTGGVQEINIIPMVTPITKMAHQLLPDSDALIWLDEMIDSCTQGRPGPCWLSVPLDVQGMVIE